MTQTVIGIFDKKENAENAYDHLLNNGFAKEQVDLSPDYATANDRRDRARDEDEGIAGFFESLFGGGDHAKKHKEAARKGTVVTVHTESAEEAAQAQSVLDQYGAVDVDDYAKSYDTDGSMGTTTTNDYVDPAYQEDKTNQEGRTVYAERTNWEDRTDPDDRTDLEDRTDPDDRTDLDDRTELDDVEETSKSIPVIEEELQVGKRVQETGRVRVRSRIVERPVEEHLRLRSEHIIVERNPVNRKATEADLESFKEGEIEMTEHAEQAVVNKEANVVEEVNLRKEVEEHEETIREKVRKTEVDVDETERDRDLEDKDRL